ncbi:MAG TPA: DUF1549 domain-containing protein, partial [Gemmataceae bacterium]|nr:DUF1549 domain-containing protein [Gemmataceae bacterium]
NANMPFDQFVIEQLAGDLLPNPTLFQKIATGFNRNHPTNSEAGEEEDEYRSAYVIDRVNTTATTFLGLTLACAQCHDHKYDPITQRDYYSFYAFFNNIKERDSDFRNPRPTIPVPNPDQEPKLADLQARIAALKERLERDDPLADAAQRAWEGKTLARLGKPVEWVTAKPSGMSSRNGALLKLLDDGSVLSTGTAPVKDTYDILFIPGRKHITALRLEVLPDDSMPEKALGRAVDGRFNLSAIEIRHSTLGDAQDPPPVYVSRAEADINQKVKEDPSPNDMFPGNVESAVVVEAVGGPGGGGLRGGGWSIVGDERKRPHEAVFLPLEPVETNDASVLRVSLHHLGGGKFKSLIGRFRISYTEDSRVRELLLPAQPKLWHSVGPFTAVDATKAFATAFEPEKDIKPEPLDLKKSYQKSGPGPAPDSKGPPAKLAPLAEAGKPEAGPPPTQVSPKPDEKPAEKKDLAETTDPGAAKPAPKAEAADGPPGDAKPVAKKGGGKFGKKAADADPKPPAKEEAKAPADAKDGPGGPKGPPKAEPFSWTEQRTWRDGQPARLQGANSAYYLTRKVVSTRARTATVRIDGPAGFKMWLNGEPVQTSAPASVTPAPAPKAEPKKGDPKADDKKDETPPDVTEIDIDEILGRAPSKTEKKFRIGLRQGENEIVLKVVFAGAAAPARPGPVVIVNGVPNPAMGGPGGGAVTFNITPEGDDVVTHE